MSALADAQRVAWEEDRGDAWAVAMKLADFMKARGIRGHLVGVRPSADGWEVYTRTDVEARSAA